MPYTAQRPANTESSEQLRARIPGWGADLDPADRPQVPRERFDPGATGAHWDFPERQPELEPRERSIEHGMLPPVFGTSVPRRGLSGKLRSFAYTLGEGRASRWILLLGADRVDVLENRVKALVSGDPAGVHLATGLTTEVTHDGVGSRQGEGRADVHHQPLDPLLVAAPWVVAAGLAYGVARVLRRRR